MVKKFIAKVMQRLPREIDEELENKIYCLKEISHEVL